jgi:hypothetical protein
MLHSYGRNELVTYGPGVAKMLLAQVVCTKKYLGGLCTHEADRERLFEYFLNNGDS